MSRRWMPLAVGAAGVLLTAAAMWFLWQRRSFERARSNANAVADSAQRYADSVRIVNAAQLGRIAQLTRSAASSDSTATVWRRRAQSVERAIAQLAATRDRLSDSLRLITTGTDSLPVLVRIVANLTSENGTLRQSRDDALRADAARQAAVDSLRLVIVADSGRYALLESSHRRIEAALGASQRALGRASPPCRLLLWGCPSRTVVAVGTAVTTAVVVLRQ